jgi:hypothetical protein
VDAQLFKAAMIRTKSSGPVNLPESSIFLTLL